MAINNYFVNSTLISGSDERGYITTTSNPQTFYFFDSERKEKYTVNSIVFECDESSPNAALLRLNNTTSHLYIGQGQSEQIDDILITKIVSISAVGTVFRFKALSNSFEGVSNPEQII